MKRITDRRKNEPFKSPADLVKVAGLEQIATALQTRITTRGSVYRLIATARIGETARTIEAVVRVGGGLRSSSTGGNTERTYLTSSLQTTRHYGIVPPWKTLTAGNSIIAPGKPFRIRAVQRILDGESPEVIAKTLGYHRSAVYQWLNRHKAAGFEGLKYQKIPGAQPKLTKAQKQKVFDVVTSKNPLQLKFAFALWTRKMVQDLILDQFAVSLSEASVGRLLHELGLTPQRPLRRAYQQNPERVAQWLKEEYPAIQREARAAKATIYFGDEAGVRSDYHSGTTWAPKGQTPVIRTTGSRYRLNLVSAVSAKGAMRFMTIKGKLNADRFIEFLERLLKNQTTPSTVYTD